MDAYIDYLRQAAESRLTGLRQEAANDSLARSLKTTRPSCWSGLAARFTRRAPRRAAAPTPPMPVRLPDPMAAETVDLRRIA